MSNPTGDALKAHAEDEPPIFTLFNSEGKKIFIWADGKVEGWDGGMSNGLPAALIKAKQEAAKRCMQIALAIDSKRGNEAEIARAIKDTFDIED